MGCWHNGKFYPSLSRKKKPKQTEGELVQGSKEEVKRDKVVDLWRQIRKEADLEEKEKGVLIRIEYFREILKLWDIEDILISLKNYGKLLLKHKIDTYFKKCGDLYEFFEKRGISRFIHFEEAESRYSKKITSTDEDFKEEGYTKL